MAFEPIGEGYVSRNFNDRRIGGKPFDKMQYRKPDEGYGHWPPRGTGGVNLPRKPKGPKTPMPARAIAMKHEVKGY